MLVRKVVLESKLSSKFWLHWPSVNQALIYSCKDCVLHKVSQAKDANRNKNAAWSLITET